MGLVWIGENFECNQFMVGGVLGMDEVIREWDLERIQDGVFMFIAEKGLLRRSD